MAESPHHADDTTLERMLTQVRAEVVFPPTPDLASRVRERITDHPRPHAGQFLRMPTRWNLAVAALVLPVLVASVLAFSPPARTVLADRLGLRGVEIIFDRPRFLPTPVAIGTNLALGEEVPLEEAQARVSHTTLRPTLPDLRRPDRVYVDESIAGGQVSLVYFPRTDVPEAQSTGVGLLLTQFQGQLDSHLVVKMLGPNTRFKPVTVNGAAGYWIEGELHYFVYRNRSGKVHQESILLAGNTLLWEQNGLTLRLESALPKTEALRIASSVR